MNSDKNQVQVPLTMIVERLRNKIAEDAVLISTLQSYNTMLEEKINQLTGEVSFLLDQKTDNKVKSISLEESVTGIKS